MKPNITADIQQQLDEIQQKIQESKKHIKYVWLVLGVFSLIALMIGITTGTPYGFIISGISIFGATSIHSYLSNKATKGFKINIISKIINDDETLDVKYFPSDHISIMEFETSKIFNQYADRYKGEDLFIGKHGETKFKFSEIKAEEKHRSTNSKGHTSTTYSTIFQGVFFIAEFNKKTKGLTRVRVGSDGFFEKLFSGKSKVVLENVEFEKVFNTYSNNQVEARYILTPDMMERILHLKKKLKSNIALSFVNNLIFIAIPNTDNYFELDRNAPVSNEQIERIFTEIDSFIQIIDLLNLNTRIWGKV